MAKYSVDSDEVLAAAASVSQAIDRIRTDVSTLNTRIQNLQGSWQGSASTQFQGAAQKWSLSQTSVQESLAALKSALDVAAQSYDEAESSATRMFAG
ncbi:WXG100 family type VII secretion target [Schumannella sp. 10F1B-5-1]|uniref:WXG100 family type VII secretion target n=1 Tax=Schumannella sp. 10F1B-5-1 TaxID=2590780 RepID=UPI0011326D3B|nr:WXG100 family type VII secretion target [Schumannella sp. 10F1B-5-1]TPW72868.1 WXG100 family type VII secretion target [Schumannella sp. 10F1B-5-1]